MLFEEAQWTDHSYIPLNKGCNPFLFGGHPSQGMTDSSSGGPNTTVFNNRAPASSHPGGVNATMGDGSTRFIKNSINLNVFQAISTRNLSEVVSGGFVLRSRASAGKRRTQGQPRTARRKAATRAGSLQPGADSTPLATSTIQGRTSAIRAATFSGVRPPARMTGGRGGAPRAAWRRSSGRSRPPGRGRRRRAGRRREAGPGPGIPRGRPPSGRLPRRSPMR